MANVINRINSRVVPSYISRELGFEDNWQKSISPRQKKIAVKTALKFKNALRKLSKN